jgi:TorA maturation chaperone TorD
MTRLEAIKARLTAETAGPWEISGYSPTADTGISVGSNETDMAALLRVAEFAVREKRDHPKDCICCFCEAVAALEQEEQ